ncbi:hypothetical protein Taro_034512 [Colocasia esculenta]|uniref:Uncharacterized protein n=1 Tax=Colocasia esculenta TaxID=4460 RepID=A0A843WAA2_COLES|nr:hypothetical protein [Colocasia esculenta]
MISASRDLAVNAGSLASRKLLQWIKSAGEALLGQSQEVANWSPRSPPSGFLGEDGSKVRPGKSPPSL